MSFKAVQDYGEPTESDMGIYSHMTRKYPSSGRYLLQMNSAAAPVILGIQNSSTSLSNVMKNSYARNATGR